jgi:phage-related protein
MKKFLFIMVIAALLVAISPVYLSPNPVRAQNGAAPHVVCVPFHGTMALVPHDAWIGKEITFKGTAHDADGDSTMSQFRWNFADGYSTGWVNGVNPYAIEARHTYTGEMADGTPYGNGKYFTASLEVKGTDGLVGQDTYFVLIGESTPELRANVAIDEGLWWLHKLQVRDTYAGNVPYGYWAVDHPVSNTGAVTEAFEVQGHLPSGNVNEDPYVETVQRGLNYLLANTHVHSISAQFYGDRDVNGNGIGLGSYSDSQRTMYECGITLMALASSIDPNRIAETGDATWVKGRAYKDIVQDMVDYLAFGQTDSGVGRGGWRYYANYGDTDNSCSQWPAIGLQAAELNFGSYGVVIPAFVKSELEIWLNASQNADGGFLYAFSGDWTQKTSNVARTGAGCAMMAFAGITPTDARFDAALSYLDAHWNATTGPMGDWDSHFGNYYAMYGVMKGMRLPEPDIVLIGSHDWYTEYRDYIVNHQNSDGGWTAIISAHNPYLGSAWALLTLIKTVEKPGPIAIAGMDMLHCPPLVAVKFDASHSYHRNPTKQIVLYQWDFESDGTWDYASPLPFAEHSYPAVFIGDDIDWGATSKNYTVTLRVTDNSEPQMRDTDTCLVGITPPPWPPVSDPDGPYYTGPGKTIKLDGSDSYDPEERMYAEDHPWYETIATYKWDLDNDGLFDDSTDIQPEFTAPASYGTYSVGLNVTDSNPSGAGGQYTEHDWSITYTELLVSSTPPVAEANGPYQIVEGKVTFSISGSFDPEGDPLEYRWDFESDGTWDTEWLLRQTQGDELVHSYVQTAEYVATLEVKDTEGLTSSDTAAVHGGPVWFTWTCPSEAQMKSEYNIVLRAESKADSSQDITFSVTETSENPSMIFSYDICDGSTGRDVLDNVSVQFDGQPYGWGDLKSATLLPFETKEFVFTIKHKWQWIKGWSACRLLTGAMQTLVSIASWGETSQIPT